ncbi:MAG: energy-coupling factor transporter transmembrane protein EcfT, partial [Lentihominibacter sp.]
YMSKRLREGMTIVSALATWSLEGGVITADSMKSRGYGCGRRSSFSNYSFEVRDKIMVIFMAVLMSAVAVSCWLGAADVVYTPDIFISSLSSFESAVGMGSYCIFLFIPTGVNIMEAVKWRILKSKI